MSSIPLLFTFFTYPEDALPLSLLPIPSSGQTSLKSLVETHLPGEGIHREVQIQQVASLGTLNEDNRDHTFGLLSIGSFCWSISWAAFWLFLILLKRSNSHVFVLDCPYITKTLASF